jgi:hypothetical protein
MIFLPAAAPAADLEFIERSERDAAVGTLSIEAQLGDGQWAAARSLPTAAGTTALRSAELR